MILATDPGVSIDQIGQAILALLLVLGAIAQQWNARRRTQKVLTATEEHTATVARIEVLVNGRQETLIARIEALEAKLELEPGEAIPTQQTVTPQSAPDTTPEIPAAPAPEPA